MNFAQAMIVPTLVSMGLGALLVARNVSLVEAGYAAPATPANPASTSGAESGKGARAAAPPAPNGAPPPIEVGLTGAPTEVVRATPEDELSVKAVESAGREDPFLQLLPPDPSAIVVPFEAAPLAKLPPVSTALPPPLPPVRPILVGPPVGPQPVGAPVLPPPKPAVAGGSAGVGGAGAALPPSPPPKPYGGDKAPTADQPQWLVRGIVSTGYERICMLEGRAGNNMSARVGDTLADGSVIEAISNRGVTFIRGGRRYVKIIGGIL